MASIFDSLRALVAPRNKQQSETPRESSFAGSVSFQDLSAKYLSCEDEKEKAELYAKLRRSLPDTLFLAAFCYDGEDASAAVHDSSLHATQGSKRLYNTCGAAVTKGNPGYRLARKSESRRMHLRSLIYNQTKEEWVPLFTDFTALLPIFGKNSRVTIISYEEARQIARPYKGLVVNPGPNAIKFANEAASGRTHSRNT